MRLLALALFLWLLPASGQELLPYVENFGKTDFGGDNQVWGATQGADRALYFANNHFLSDTTASTGNSITCPTEPSFGRCLLTATVSIADRIGNLGIGSAPTVGWPTLHSVTAETCFPAIPTTKKSGKFSR